MIRHAGRLTRRQLIQSFGALAFVMTPVARSMGYIAGGPFTAAPRYLMCFKGPSYHSPSVRPTSLSDLAGGPLAALLPHQEDLVVFQGMNIHGGSPKTDGYKEEHGGGLMGCVTGHSYHYYESDAYMAYTDHQSFDVMLGDHYASRTSDDVSKLPFSRLHLGAGAHSDCDSCGLGQRYISYTNRTAGNTQYYSNAIEPVQDVAQVYAMMMERVNLVCSSDSNQPNADREKLLAALKRKKSLLDFRVEDIESAKRALGVDSEHAQKFDGLLEGWRETERTVDAQILAAEAGAPVGAQQCPTSAALGGNGNNKKDLDDLSPVHDAMIDLVKLAFEWDLTRVVALTLSGASSGQRWSSQGITSAHHSMEHSNNVAGLNKMGEYTSQKFARLLASLKEIDDGEGKSALYNSAVLLGMECWSDSSNGHYLKDIPFVLAGQAAGAFETGRVVQAGGRNNNDIYVAIQNAAGIDSSSFGLESLCQGAII